MHCIYNCHTHITYVHLMTTFFPLPLLFNGCSPALPLCFLSSLSPPSLPPIMLFLHLLSPLTPLSLLTTPPSTPLSFQSPYALLLAASTLTKLVIRSTTTITIQDRLRLSRSSHPKNEGGGGGRSNLRLILAIWTLQEPKFQVNAPHCGLVKLLSGLVIPLSGLVVPLGGLVVCLAVEPIQSLAAHCSLKTS